jgi:SAM-dependent methyltransferase
MNKKKYKIKKNIKYGYYSIDPLPNVEELNKFYEELYYQNNIGQYEDSYSPEEIKFLEEDSIILEYLYSKFFLNSSRKFFLDLGCGEGYQSNYFYKKKWNLRCFDYSNFGLRKHNPHLETYFEKGDINSFLNQNLNKYSIIMLKNVLEHVIDPISLLKQIKNIMDEESFLLIDVPNDYSNFQRMLISKGYTKNTWFIPPQHIHYFQFPSIKKALEGEGFEIISIQSGFPIEMFLVNEFSNYTKNKERGKSSHNSRVEISNFLISQGVDKYINYRESLARIEFGRDIKVIVKLKK